VVQETFSDVTRALAEAAMPVRELHGAGHVAVTSAAGRIIALAFSKDAPNLLWSNPHLTDAERAKKHPEKLVGGLGGDRLWFSPELDYLWKGVPRWDTAANYEVPEAMDPGAYEFVENTANTIVLTGAAELLNRANGLRVTYNVTRTIRQIPSPLPDADPLLRKVDYVGIETSHLLQFGRETEAGRLDLWHLLQARVGSVLIVPLRATASPAAKKPLSYALPGAWIQKPDKVLWRYGGTARAKIGISAAALTGRTALLQRLGSRGCLIVRQFDVDENGKYADHPYEEPRTDQAFQAWDGLGFGEMEYHSPMLDAQRGPRMMRESDRLWAFAGSNATIAGIAERLLDLDVSDAFALLDEAIS
jgi:hypothetical protein